MCHTFYAAHHDRHAHVKGTLSLLKDTKLHYQITRHNNQKHYTCSKKVPGRLEIEGKKKNFRWGCPLKVSAPTCYATIDFDCLW